MRRTLKITGILLGLLTVLVLSFGATWERWLDGYAERKMMAVLTAKFEKVEHGEFVLTKDEVVVQDLVLSNPDAHVTVRELRISYTPDYWNQRAIVSHVEVVEGSSSGTLDGFRQLKGKSKATSSSGRLDLSGSSLLLRDHKTDLQVRGYRAQATVTASGDSLKGPFEVVATAATISEGGAVLGSAATAHTTLDRTALFPLDVEVSGVSSAPMKRVAIKDVEGSVGIKDMALNALAFDLRGKTDAGQSWSFDGTINREEALAAGHLVAKDIRPSQLPLADLPIDPEHGLLSIDLQVNRNHEVITVSGSSSLRGLQVSHRRLSRETVFLGGDIKLEATADINKRELVVKTFSVKPRQGEGLSPVQIEVSGRVLWTPDPKQREFELSIGMEESPCQSVFDAMPPGFLPGLSGFELGGNTTIDLHAVVKMHDSKATVLEGGLDIRKCKLKKMPETVKDLEGPFIHLVQMKNGHVVQRPLMHGHAFFASYNQMPGYVASAVLATEDGGFWKHKGWRPHAFHESLARNVELGTFRRGGSTLTMQMVKNVLLTHEKTISRKAQEMFLTWVVETHLTKQRIIEIYLNVVEFGPGIFGIAHAADHYFGKSVDQLTSLESAFMATLLPRPLGRHAMWCRNKLTPNHDKYIRKIHARMLRKSGKVTQEEYDAAEAQGIVFTRAGFTTLADCLSEGERAKGPHTQGALSGLMGER